MYDSITLFRLMSTADSGLWLGRRILLPYEMHFRRLILYLRKKCFYLYIIQRWTDPAIKSIQHFTFWSIFYINYLYTKLIHHSKITWANFYDLCYDIRELYCNLQIQHRFPNYYKDHLQQEVVLFYFIIFFNAIHP